MTPNQVIVLLTATGVFVIAWIAFWLIYTYRELKKEGAI